MKPTRTQRIKFIFLRASELDFSARTRLLDAECGNDDSLRTAVESLLDKVESVPGEFLEPPADVSTAADRARSKTNGALPNEFSDSTDFESEGDFVGAYRLVRKIGQGGFGIVWEAEQTHPMKRVVALKMIKAGMDSQQVLARFELERQALARLDHPNISTVLDAGSTASGRPYFVMELVRGTPLLEYCAVHKPNLASRLELHRRVCLALHHAHRRGIIHRDIKPSNILVLDHDGEVTPKVIDFGIAKATGTELSPLTTLTQHRQLMGTPAYMSPEQAHLGQQDVDIRADVYSLGVLLYALLTGKPPFDNDTLSNSTLDEALRIIREDDPPKPSTRAPGVPSDLDWIAMKCLEKDRERRYESAHELAEDIHRYLVNEPVLAGPPDVAYRLSKYYRRHRNAVLTASAVAALLFVVVSVGFVWTTWKNRQLAGKNVELDASNLELEREKLAAQEALKNVERLSDARLLDELEAKAAFDFWPARPEKVEAMQEWLHEAEAVVTRLPRHREALERFRAGATRHEAEPPNAATITFLEAKRDGLLAAIAEADRVPNIFEKTLRDIDASLKTGESWVFEATRDAWFHNLLTDLVERIEDFSDPQEGMIASVEKRMAYASSLEQSTLKDHQQKWDLAVHQIVTGTRYPTLKNTGMRPQIGLVPLGVDPDSELQEFLHFATHDGPIPERDEVGMLTLTETTGVILVLIPGGTYTVGAQSGDPNALHYDANANPNEGPVRDVEIEPFLISKYELTQANWGEIENGRNPSYFYAGGFLPEFGNYRMTLRHPVEQVSWTDCRKYLPRVGLALPTEDQWEIAARGGLSSPWSTGAEATSLSGFANIAAESHKHFLRRYEAGVFDQHCMHSPVGFYRPNPFGLHDVHGNVREWCTSVYFRKDAVDAKGEAPTTSDVTSGRVRARGRRGALHRVVRGGCYADEADDCRASKRLRVMDNKRGAAIGVRPTRPIL